MRIKYSEDEDTNKPVYCRPERFKYGDGFSWYWWDAINYDIDFKLYSLFWFNKRMLYMQNKRIYYICG